MNAAAVEHVGQVVVELAEKWRRADAGDFGRGRAHGYAQAIALLLGRSASDVLRDLREGVL